MDKTKIISDIDQSTAMLMTALMQFDESNFNHRPANGWSAGDIAEHVLLLETLVNNNLLSAHSTQRPHDAKLTSIVNGMQDNKRKFVSPEFIHPTSAIKQITVIPQKIKQQRERLKQMVLSTDLTETTNVPHPQIGDMTRLEWIYFITTHAARHVQQMDAIRESEGSVQTVE